MTTCRSCGSDVLFATSVPNGKLIPLDVAEVEPAPGAILLTPKGIGYPFSRVAGSPDGTWHVSHFATCPQADQWRKR